MTTELARIENNAAVAYTPRDIVEAFTIADHYAKSGLIKGLETAQKVMLVMAHGAERGIPPTTALMSIHIIEGRPSMAADLIVGLCLSKPEVCKYFDCIETTNEKATYETQRTGRPPRQITFTIEDAERQGLLAKKGGNWDKTPRAMLRHRASSELARMVYPDIVQGTYDPDELGGLPEYVADAVVMETPKPKREKPPAPAPVVATVTPPTVATGSHVPPPVQQTAEDALFSEPAPAPGPATQAVNEAFGNPVMAELIGWLDACKTLGDVLATDVKIRSKVPALNPDERKKLVEHRTATMARCKEVK